MEGSRYGILRRSHKKPKDIKQKFKTEDLRELKLRKPPPKHGPMKLEVSIASKDWIVGVESPVLPQFPEEQKEPQDMEIDMPSAELVVEEPFQNPVQSHPKENFKRVLETPEVLETPKEVIEIPKKVSETPEEVLEITQPPKPSKPRSRSRSPKGEESLDIFEQTPPESEEELIVRQTGDELQDLEGYYIPQVGELIIDYETPRRFKIQAVLGKGVYSNVVLAYDLESTHKHAIKILRNNEAMIKAGQKEIKVLQLLNENDPQDRKHIIRLQSHFYYRSHLCIVFEELGLNLREVLQKYGSEKGLSLEAVRSFCKQAFIALAYLQRHSVIHCDIKPDNMLLSKDLRKLKLSDFGTALTQGENTLTEHLVARFYRPPEIFLGYPYDSSLDVWSLGCSLFELYTGKVLFPGVSNSHMLELIMQLKGPIPKKMRTQGQFASEYFDKTQFLHSGVPIQQIKKEKSLGVKLNSQTKNEQFFENLLEQCLTLDPQERIQPHVALKHPFLNTTN